jgi:hypothetical protein
MFVAEINFDVLHASFTQAVVKLRVRRNRAHVRCKIHWSFDVPEKIERLFIPS